MPHKNTEGTSARQRLQQKRAPHIILHAQGCGLLVEVGWGGGASAQALVRTGPAASGQHHRGGWTSYVQSTELSSQSLTKFHGRGAGEGREGRRCAGHLAWSISFACVDACLRCPNLLPPPPSVHSCLSCQIQPCSFLANLFFHTLSCLALAVYRSTFHGIAGTSAVSQGAWNVGATQMNRRPRDSSLPSQQVPGSCFVPRFFGVLSLLSPC